MIKNHFNLINFIYDLFPLHSSSENLAKKKKSQKHKILMLFGKYI